jgi:mRNA interferase MazF
MRRGDVYRVDLDPAAAAEQNKTRPCVIVSNDGSNATAQRLGRGVVTIVPITTHVSFVGVGFEVAVTSPDDIAAMGLAGTSRVQANQVRTVSTARLARRIGRCRAELLGAIDEALSFHLSL